MPIYYTFKKETKEQTDRQEEKNKLVRIKLWEKRRLERTIENLLPLSNEH